jgi:hypothetical protein
MITEEMNQDMNVDKISLWITSMLCLGMYDPFLGVQSIQIDKTSPERDLSSHIHGLEVYGVVSGSGH